MLNPRKNKDIIKLTAAKHDVSEEFVEEIISIYWKEIKKYLSELRGVRVEVWEFGSFIIRPWLLPRWLRYYKGAVKKTNYLASKHQLNYKQFAIMKEMKNRLKQLEHAQELVNQELIKKQLVNEKVKKYQAEKNISIKKTDLGGTD